ncbi:FecR family protein [Mucilaginibacter pedocola]|uniref:FecR protein domain-containing protein n=1 Tax=Mucilaginibacter pedocola TaxID=1792845 RepID=A0A1S9P9X3_9SPHI|nr:FecR domain-containing protein [Mucilaginibacter pedocola]OOQ57786.1 hypothetical protein BC343_13450 [Mucilaginibacter pedocola]
MKRKDRDSLKRYFDQYREGTGSKRNKATLDEWFGEAASNPIPNLLKDPVEELRIYREMTTRINKAIRPDVKKIRPISAYWLRAASIIAVIGAVGFGVWRFGNKPSAHIDKPSPTFEAIATQNKQMKKFMLPDGSEVWLNSASSIRFDASSFNNGSRIVYLDEGEAYFKVTHDASHPFYVFSGRARTRVLGTEFNVRAYNDTKKISIAVVTGKVAVDERDANGRFKNIAPGLIKGESITMAANKAALSNGLTTSSINAWREGRSSYLTDATLEEIAAEIARKYDLKVSVKHPELDKRHYSLQINGLSTDDLLQQLMLQTGISYRLYNQQLIIYPQKYRP